MIHAYFDESGIHEGAGVCVIAGYFGGPSQMRKLGGLWSDVLRRYSVEEFHAKEFWGFNDAGERVGQYKGWSKRKAEDFIEELLNTVEGNPKIHPVGSGVVIECFNRLSHNQRRFVTGAEIRNGKFTSTGCPSKPYFLPFHISVIDAADYAPTGGKAHYFFDLNKNFKGYALDAYALMKLQELKIADRLGEIEFPTGLEAAQLQAADLLCYQSYQYSLKRRHNPDEKQPKILTRLLRHRLTQTDSWFNDEGLALILKDVEIPQDSTGQ